MHRNDKGFELAEPKFEGRKPLYRLHNIVTNPDSVIWITEGEQKVDALEVLGLVATTIGGATSAAGTDWKPLRGRTCVIWPDNDERGKAYGATLEVSYKGWAAPCHVSMYPRSVYLER